MEWSDGQKKQLKGHTYQVWNASFDRCLLPDNRYTRSTIRVHSVQQQGSMTCDQNAIESAQRNRFKAFKSDVRLREDEQS